MIDMQGRPCGNNCFTYDNRPHLAPTVDWVGDVPILHGERDVPWGHAEQEYCLCGHPQYYLCPEELRGGILSMTVGDPYGGRFDT